MDYLPPPERPVLIAQASERLLAEYHRHWYKLVDTGLIDQMPIPENWSDMTTWVQRLHLKDLKPGQKIPLLKPEKAAEPVVYIEQHNACSEKEFETFAQIIKERQTADLSEQQLKSLDKILGARATDKSYRTQASVMDLGGRRGINMFFGKPAENKVGRAFLFVADSKHHLIQEVGYEGAKGGGDPWRKDAEDMLNNIEFVKANNR